jgi:DNA-binding NarL/FixJ family response regulator
MLSVQPPPSGAIRVAIADDEALVRHGLRAMLEAEPDIEVVAEAVDGSEAVDLARRVRPDVFVMDIRMPVVDGIEATRRIAAAVPSTRVLVVTTFDLDGYVFAALRAGAAGFLLKAARPAQLVQAVRTSAAGDALVSPAGTRRLVEHFTATDGPAGGLTELTSREHDVLRLIARGMANREIAQTLFLSEKTVKTHVTRVLAKLGVTSRTQAVVYAYESGLVRVGDNSETAAPLDERAAG